jgi:hypothetical protein
MLDLLDGKPEAPPSGSWRTQPGLL